MCCVSVVGLRIDVNNINLLSDAEDGFGGLAVSMLASGTQVCAFKLGRSR